MNRLRLLVLTAFVMGAFAANSLLCRAALGNTALDPATFTSLRLLSGAIVLWILARDFKSPRLSAGSWLSALVLAGYAAAFSFAYVSLSTGTGALLLFGAVQLTMIATGLARGERLSTGQILGLVLALGGIVVLVLPGVTAPSPLGAATMLAAGAAWGVYSLRGRGSTSPLRETAGNFRRALLFGALVSCLGLRWLSWDLEGALYAVLSGGLASGMGYAIWYLVLPELRATTAAIVQLSVPVIAAVAGVVVLGESAPPRLAVASLATLSGIGLVVARARRA